MNIDLLRRLSSARAISGQEDDARQIIIAAIEGQVEELRVDTLGNILASKPGSQGAGRPRVMVTAHMDEIGLVVRGITAEGLLRCYNVGGIDARILPGLRVAVGAEALPGVVLWKPIHLGREQKSVPLDKLHVDIGARDRAEAARLVRPGDMITFAEGFSQPGPGSVRGKALDNRAGCALLVELLQDAAWPCDLLVAFTCQEEIGLRGAQVAAQALQPDVAIVLETTPAHDLPDLSADADERAGGGPAFNPATRLGAGPALTVMDTRMITDPRLLAWLRAGARAAGIPLQLKSMRGGGTDGGAIHIAGSGVPTAVVAMPARYVHGPAALLRVSDYDHTLALLRSVLPDLSAATLARD